MGTFFKTQRDKDDSFEELAPQPVRCRWLNERDQKAAQSAKIIRLIVDNQRGYLDPLPNDSYQGRFLRDVREFIGPTNAVLVTEAGAITTGIDPLYPTLSSFEDGFNLLTYALKKLDFGDEVVPDRQEILLGVDGCLPNRCIHLQTVVHINTNEEPKITFSNTAVKLYPTGTEKMHLVGWQICGNFGRVPSELARGRCIQTASGPVLVLVCNDACLFSPRSRSNLASGVGLEIRRHFLEPRDPPPQFILIATHWQGTGSTGRWCGEAFRQALDYLVQKTGATVVATLRAPRHELTAAAHRFAVRGPQADKVATLVVEDTFENP